jgi:uncharacterized protein
MLTPLLLVVSNIFMTFAWYWQLRFPKWTIATAVMVGWSIAFVEYCFAIPANRIGYARGYSGEQLKIMQEVITLAVFVPFAVFYMKQPPKLDYLWAAFCLMGAVYFVFRTPATA